MTFEPKKFDQIFEDMRARTSVVTDFDVGSVTRSLFESFAIELALLYEKMGLVYLSGYVDSARGTELDNVVSILGIRRGLPDFAEGLVTFTRDIGNDDIAIPIGSLVATEDQPEAPKKVYQTLEQQVLPQDRTEIDVRVRAVARGEDQTAEAETVVVMPQPIAGIKEIVNRSPIVFVGKVREDDDALRQRAKDALISSGKATAVSIANAVLGLPRVTDVRVNEDFHVASGTVRFGRGTATGEVVIPRGTRVTADDVVPKPFEVTEETVLASPEDSVEVGIRSLVDGATGEVPVSGAAWSVAGSPFDTMTVANDEPILRGDVGVIEVIVDGIDFTDGEEVAAVREEIDQVRAAGILVILKPSTAVEVDGVFRVELNPSLSVSPDERAGFEEDVRLVIVDFLGRLRMGEPFLFSKLISDILDVEGVDNLDDFQITTTKDRGGAPVEVSFTFADKRIDGGEVERLVPRHLCVASGDKTLPVHVQFKADGLDADVRNAVVAALEGYFAGLAVGDPVPVGDVEAVVGGVPGIVLASQPPLALAATSWCRRPTTKETEAGRFIDTTFVEQPVLGDVFAYRIFLDITGALSLTLPTTFTAEEKDAVRTAIEQAVASHLDGLGPEVDLVLTDLVDIAGSVSGVLAVDLDEADFRVAIDGADAPAKVTEDKIEVGPFEKARLGSFCISGEIETVEITVEAVALQLAVPSDPPPEFDEAATIAAIRLAVKNALNNLLAGAAPGEDLTWGAARGAIESLVPGANYNVVQLSLTANSLCDGRTQQTAVATALDLHIRSNELAVMVPITDADVTVTTVTV